VPHVLAVAHGIDPFMSIGMVRRWLDAAPTTCHGIMMDENSHFVTHFRDGSPQLAAQLDSFIDRFMLPVMDVCLEKKKRFYLMEKQLWWVALPAVKKYADCILAPKYRSIIAPMVEESNSRCPQLNFVARVGLWRMGSVQHWGLNLIDDQLRTCKAYEYNLGEAHAALRHYVAYAAAGATEFKVGKLMYLFCARRGDEQSGTRIGNIRFRRAGLLALDTFMHLLGKGLLVPPTREEIEGLSPVAFRMQSPDDGFWLSARMRDPATISPRSRNGLFSGHDWGLTRPSPYYASSYLMNTKRHGHQVGCYHGMPNALSCLRIRATSQSLTAPALLPEASQWPSGEKATAVTLFTCTSQYACSFPVCASNSMTAPCALPQATIVPSGLTANDIRSCGRTCQQARWRPLATSYT